MMPSELKALNRKQRTHMSVRKGSQKVSHVILQEGIPTIETIGPDKASAEPVIYLFGEQVDRGILPNTPSSWTGSKPQQSRHGI